MATMLIQGIATTGGKGKATKQGRGCRTDTK
eukprot:CAMPEP_0204566600 /NCGR_PEP_ID=MMETSP0661-20131031/36140_1 /ASSEMBLY_ACC=CAM_ASM_000606 /TAXON_ID=109239 /ORGANISM="Alexandrium margalefi, Strain AMGDE01CS-322" /LENGTH=30 /DNA_ID= /DNA_START= /DNA_END= /DNA_ORIENTATION=